MYHEGNQLVRPPKEKQGARKQELRPVRGVLRGRDNPGRVS